MKTVTILPVAALAAMACLLTAPASAESVSVEYADLNLASEKGLKRLEQRIDKAARQVCGVDAQRPGTRLKTRELECYRTAKRNAAVQVAGIIRSRSLRG